MQFKNNKNQLFYKYNKITQQKKFHLLNLVLQEKQSIKQAAQIVEINYSTAKTIIFFHRNQLKSYQFDFKSRNKLQRRPHRLPAGFMEIPIFNPTHNAEGQVPPFRFEQIKIVSTIGSKSTNIDFNSLQTRFMDNHLDATNSYSPRDNQLINTVADSQVQLRQMQICQCERRKTRAQSAKQAQASNINFYPAIKQGQSYQVSPSQQHKNQ